jgi:hypothetical protein
MSLSPTTMRAKERPVFVTRETSAVRAVVASWHGRTLRVQHTVDLQRTLAALEPFEDKLADLSPHAPRLLHNLRIELAKPERQPAA